MLSMENCVSPDGKTISYDSPVPCASMGLKEYHWQVEPFHHLGLWLQTTAGEIVTMMVIGTVLVLVMAWRDKSTRTEHGADTTA